MKFKTSHIVIVVLAAICLLLMKCKDRNQEVKEIYSVDTCYVFITDTIVEYVPNTVTRIVKDTVFVKTTDGYFAAAQVVQKYFSNADVYDLWISGVEPLNVDSVKVYGKTEHKVITRTIERTIEKKERKLFAGGGISSFNGSLAPYVTVSFQDKKERLYGLNLGVYDNGLFYGGSVSFRIK